MHEHAVQDVPAHEHAVHERKTTVSYHMATIRHPSFQIKLIALLVRAWVTHSDSIPACRLNKIIRLIGRTVNTPGYFSWLVTVPSMRTLLRSDRRAKRMTKARLDRLHAGAVAHCNACGHVDLFEPQPHGVRCTMHAHSAHAHACARDHSNRPSNDAALPGRRTLLQCRKPCATASPRDKALPASREIPPHPLVLLQVRRDHLVTAKPAAGAVCDD